MNRCQERLQEMLWRMIVLSSRKELSLVTVALLPFGPFEDTYRHNYI